MDSFALDFSLFEKCPPAKVLFGFPLDMDPTCERLRKSQRFVAHAKHMIDMLDRAVHMLGPDAELLEEMLFDCKPAHTLCYSIQRPLCRLTSPSLPFALYLLSLLSGKEARGDGCDSRHLSNFWGITFAGLARAAWE